MHEREFGLGVKSGPKCRIWNRDHFSTQIEQLTRKTLKKPHKKQNKKALELPPSLIQPQYQRPVILGLRTVLHTSLHCPTMTHIVCPRVRVYIRFCRLTHHSHKPWKGYCEPPSPLVVRVAERPTGSTFVTQEYIGHRVGWAQGVA